MGWVRRRKFGEEGDSLGVGSERKGKPHQIFKYRAGGVGSQEESVVKVWVCL